MSCRRPQPIHAALALALGAACTISPPSADAASPRNYLTVQGRVMNHVGRPVRDAWVFSLGSRRASARVDTSGWYQLEIPGATLEELQRTALKIRIQARKTGWRFALSSGAPELGLEMRVVAEEAKLARLRVRSNDSTAVEAVASSVVLDANPRALLIATFVGSEGPQLDTPAVPLEVTQEITLAGTATSIPELGATEELSLPVTAGGSSTAPSRTSTGQTSESVASGDPVVQGQSRGEGATDTYSSPQTTSPTPAGTSSKPKSVRPAQGSGAEKSSGPRVVRPALESDPKASAASSTPSSASSGSKPNPSSSAASGASASAPSSAPSSGKQGTSSSAPPKAAPAARTPPGVPATTSGSAATSRDTARTSTSSGSSLAKDAAIEADRSLQRVYSRFDPMVSVGAKQQPPTRRAEGAGREGEGASSVSEEPCDCVIRGTVEVQSEYPLRGRTEVVIAVEDSPQVTSNVELFMGSPRAFEIRRAPCGVHRLRLYTRSKQRFVLTSVEPRVVCREGSKQQIRLIMEPVARWGIAP